MLPIPYHADIICVKCKREETLTEINEMDLKLLSEEGEGEGKSKQ